MSDDFVQDLQVACRKRGMGRSVIERVLRLNPQPKQGNRLRGWHPAFTAKMRAAWQGWTSKGSFMRLHGRAAWEAIPNGAKHKEGRRQYVSREFMEDEIWRVYTGEIKREIYAVFKTRRYFNDRRGAPWEYVKACNSGDWQPAK